jgi:hypothetical protein
MRFECSFNDPSTGECKAIVISLSAKEVESITSLRKVKGTETADVTALAYALRHAYREVPRGFLHTEQPREVVAS